MSGHVGTKRLVVMNRHDFDGGRFTPVLTFSLSLFWSPLNTTLFILTCLHLEYLKLETPEVLLSCTLAKSKERT